jgi:hypothetical protein
MPSFIRCQLAHDLGNSPSIVLQQKCAVQSSIVPASAAAVSNVQNRLVSSSSIKSEQGVPGGDFQHLQHSNQAVQTSACPEQHQEGDCQMRAFRGVLRVVLVVLESCLSLAGFPVPGFSPQNEANAAIHGYGDGQEPSEPAMRSASSDCAQKLAAQHQQWCSCMAQMWRNILGCLSAGTLAYYLLLPIAPRSSIFSPHEK